MKTRRPWLIAAAAAVVGLVALFFFLQTPKHLATTPDGRIHFITVKHESGTSFSTAFSSRGEAWVRDVLFDIGFRKVQRTSFKMISPPDSHLFILEYSGDAGEMEPSSIQAELLQRDGTKYPLITIGGDSYGFQERRFVYWVLNGVQDLDRQGLRLKVHLPEDDPTVLPIRKE